MAIRWKVSLSVGVPLIDAQHQEIIRRAAALIAAMRASRGEVHIQRTLRFLTSYTATHFVAEERLMLDRAYPATEAHAQEHDALRARVRQLVYAFQGEGASLAVATHLNTLVCQWIFDHIGKSDQALGTWLQEHAATASLRRDAGPLQAPSSPDPSPSTQPSSPPRRRRPKSRSKPGRSRPNAPSSSSRPSRRVLHRAPPPCRTRHGRLV